MGLEWTTWWIQLSMLVVVAIGAAWVSHRRASRRSHQKLQALILERTRELEEAQDQLVRREKLAVLGELAGSVAHELRNPLAVIKNSTFFLRLKLGSADDKVGEHLALIERKLEVSNRIITELLNWGREPQPEIERIALQRVLEEELADLGIPGEIQLEKDLATESLRVDADPGQIGRILGNLLRNAIQAMPEGGTLLLGCRGRGDEVELSVADTGVGIAPEVLPKIFEPLYTSKAKGIGLGLPVSQRYARANGGRIECESSVGQGATFRLLLPSPDRSGEVGS